MIELEAVYFVPVVWKKVKRFSDQIALMMKRADEEPKGKRQCNTEKFFRQMIFLVI